MRCFEFGHLRCYPLVLCLCVLSCFCLSLCLPCASDRRLAGCMRSSVLVVFLFVCFLLSVPRPFVCVSLPWLVASFSLVTFAPVAPFSPLCLLVGLVRLPPSSVPFTLYVSLSFHTHLFHTPGISTRSMCIGACHACTASHCDLPDPGWGDPGSRHCDFFAWHLSAHPMMFFDLSFCCFSGWPARYEAHKLPGHSAFHQ